MFYYALVEYSYNGEDFVSFDIVYAEDKNKAMRKVLVLHGDFVSISKIELTSYSTDDLERIKSAYGGASVFSYRIDPC
jgi:hypothetical protein